LTDGVRRADRGERLAELHATVERLRGMLGTTTLTADEREAAEPLDRLVRERRDELFAAVRATENDPGGRTVRADAADLFLLWSHLTVRLAPTGSGPVREDAVRILTEAERELGPHPVIARDRAEFLEDLGRPAEALTARRRAEEAPARTADDHFAVGCYEFRAGRVDDAVHAFGRAVDLDPAAYWGWYYLGRCHAAAGRLPDALVAFAVCTGIRSDQPTGYLQKAQVHLMLGQTDDAVRCLDRVRQLDPRNATAAQLRDRIDRNR
jgi:tetratricopeptide (TPR) repeat protein